LELPKIKSYNDPYSKHQTLVPLVTGKPWISVRAFVAPSATIAGSVEIGEHSSIWYRCVIKGDSRYVRIGTFVNIQDGTVINEAGRFLDEEHDGSTVIGHYSTIGHNCRITGATIEPCCHVGMGSVLMEGSYMESYSMLGAGSVLAAGARVPSFELWVGSPAKFVRNLTDHEKEEIFLTSQAYSLYGQDHAEWIYELKDGEAYKQALKMGLQPGYRKKRLI
jgi:carbonic anhydrase/acetyltransferase-like protein (isoleucine patch superfamily)